MRFPISWLVLCIWLLFIAVGFIFFPISWLVHGRLVPPSLIGLSLFAAMGSIVMSAFVRNDVSSFCKANTQRSCAAALTLVVSVYAIIGLAIGSVVRTLGGDELIYLAWVVFGIYSICGIVVVIAVYRESASSVSGNKQ